MESVSVELYIIGYTFIGIILLFLYTLPLRIVARAYKGMKWIITNWSKGWKIF